MSNTGLNGAPTFASVLRDYGRDKRQGSCGRLGRLAVLSHLEFSAYLAARAHACLADRRHAVLRAAGLSMPVLALTLPLEQAARVGAGRDFVSNPRLRRRRARPLHRAHVTAAERSDFLIDMAQWGLLYGSIGLLADRVLDTGALWTAVAARPPGSGSTQGSYAMPARAAPTRSARPVRNGQPARWMSCSGSLPG
ncbi:MAG: hypothetical protein HPM95_06175 [Alphaproteobacteria bacterium]|nr:hypothetical protein [Alphaproteobacteria bacterium]